MLLLPTLCLALNIYYEARGESIAGQIAVTQVVLNRVYSNKFPNNICDVIQQKNQFSWFWDGKSDMPKDHSAWVKSVEIAHLVYYLPLGDITRGALYYHADWIEEQHNHNNPVIIGRHIFY